MIDDPVINDAMTEIRLAALTDQNEAMRLYREKIFKYIVTKAYAVPDVIGTNHAFWWPWLKNYSGEEAVGYDDYNWMQWIWIDQDLKKSMGY
ncbi:MAG: hypothetical protein HYX80_03390 [Chloroflexi bacterium]|nr:hypothetical protein [Chloroflexota bacterium]